MQFIVRFVMEPKEMDKEYWYNVKSFWEYQVMPIQEEISRKVAFPKLKVLGVKLKFV